MKEYKEIQESVTMVQRKIEGSEYIGKDGRTYVKTRWERIDKPINFGSCAKKKNADVLLFKIEVPAESMDDNFFTNIFGKRK